MENIKPQKTEKKHKMASVPVKNLMLKMGAPMILSMMLQAAYNIVDSAFVSNMKVNGEAALNALTLAFPVQMLMVAIAIGTGVGANVLIAKSLGAGDSEKAKKAAGNTVFLAAVIYVVFLLFGIFASKAYISTQSQNELISGMATDYLMICCVLSFGIVFFSVFEKMLQATGKSGYSTAAQIAGAVVNIILDPIMIYGLLGMPEMGVRGAAYATVIGQIASFAVALAAHIKVNSEIRIKPENIKPSAGIIREIYKIGFPAIVSQALMSAMTYLLNIIFVGIGENVVTAYGLYYKIQQFILFAAFGLRDAITPIVSFSHGMRDSDRVKDGIKYGLIYTLAIMLAGLLVLEIFANPLTSLFGLSGETEQLCISAVRIVSLSLVFAGINIALQGVFQALGRGMESLLISVLRQLAIIIPAAYLLSCAVIKGSLPVYAVWFSFLIAEGISAVVSVAILRRMAKKQIAEA